MGLQAIGQAFALTSFSKTGCRFIVSFLASTPDPEKDSTAVQNFLAQTEASFRAHPLWAGATEEELESAGEVSMQHDVVEQANGKIP